MYEEALISEITRLVMKAISEENANQKPDDSISVPIGVSARHLHLTREHVDKLFGAGYELKKKSVLMGGQYACEEVVTIVGTKLSAIENVRILGPERKNSQVEISKTDSVKLGINPPVRDSGNIKESAPIALVGPCGVVYLTEGCIIAKRHIHMSEKDGEKYGLCDGSLVSVKMPSQRGGVLPDVLVRVDKSFTLEMHIDTDEGNALGIKTGDSAIILK